MKLTQIKGIGPKKLEKLQELGIESVDDLINYLPAYYENRTVKTNLISAMDGEKQYFELVILTPARTYFVKKNMTITRLKAKDDTDEINLVWYNDRFSAQNLKVGERYKFFGRFQAEKKSMSNPIFCTIDEDMIGGIYPIYSVIRGLSKKELIKFKDRAFEALKAKPDYLDDGILEENNLLNTDQTLRVLHRPATYLDLYKAKKSYLIREKILDILAGYFYRSTDSQHIKFEKIDMSEVFNSLDFELTNGQKSALNEIIDDMSSSNRMNRILIGDVGSGKTIVAILAAILAVKNGYQVAFLAPTELLAIQHYQNYFSFLKNFNISSNILLGSSPKSQKDEIYEDLSKGQIDLIFGTHALFQKSVNFSRLGLVITDEQQRFGVYQRKLMVDKGKGVDQLSLSATPIPRTLALTLYKDLDVSLIETLPNDRLPIESYLVDESLERRFVNFAEKQLQSGRQVYVVCPRVEDDEELEVNSVESIYRRYKKHFVKRCSVDMLHGQMSPEDKINKRKAFLDGKIDILISTTIIEVGIDVKNASLMIIYDANYFGLSQLHQLRGRIGRGPYQSYCIFVAKADKIDDKLKFIENFNDGFKIAEKDLELRGAGDRFGLYQSGFSDNFTFDIYNQDLDQSAAQIADELIKTDKVRNDSQLKNLIDNKLLAYEKIIMN